MAAATYDKKVNNLSFVMFKNMEGTNYMQVVMLDRREGPRKCSFYKVHSKPVLAVKLSERQVTTSRSLKSFCKPLKHST